MWKKIRDNIWLVVSLCAVFVAIYLFFTRAHPIVPYDGDDWRYLGWFRRPLPTLQEWNPSRVLPEIITPLAGYFAAFFVTPLTGDYLGSITITAGLVMAAFVTVFFLVLYRLFLAFSRSKTASVFCAALFICVYFALFKTKAESQYMLYSYNLNTIFAYTIPNLLNSIMVCILMRWAGCRTLMSREGLGTRKLVVLVLVLYFSVFSIMFSAAVLAVYCFYMLLLGIIRKDKAPLVPYILILAGFAVYCFYELAGTRANSGSGGTTNYSVFSAEFAEQILFSWWNLLGLLQQMNIVIVGITMGIIFLALILYRVNIETDRKNPIVMAGAVCFLSFASMVPALILVSAKAGASYCSLTHSTYSIFFYYLLLAALSLVYIISKVPGAVITLPFLLIVVFMETTNSQLPYMDQSSYVVDYLDRGISTVQKKQLASGWIAEIQEADKQGARTVAIRVPQSTGPDWPLSQDWFGEAFSHTLYAHGLISRTINITLESDVELLYSLVGGPPDASPPEEEGAFEETGEQGGL
jgi:hypothetical protein